jgi:transposase
MPMNELFRVALGFDEPWKVQKVEFVATEGQLHIWLDFPAGSTFPCPSCGKTPCGVYDTEERTWRHLNFFEHRTLLHARVPRVECPADGVKTVPVPWAQAGSGFTLLMEAYILLLVQGGMTPAQVGRLIGAHDTRVWRVLKRYVDQARDQADFSEVTMVGVDETSRARGHEYITVFMDLAPEKRRVLFACPGRDHETFEAFAQDLEAHHGSPAQIRDLCMDMSPAYMKGAAEHLAQAQVTFDPFHVAKLAGEAVDQVRREERRTRPELTGSRYVWLKNEWNLTAAQAAQLDTLARLNLKTARAFRLKSVLQDLFTPQPLAEGAHLLRQWCNWAQRSRLGPMVELARTLRRHWDGVVNWFRSQISNGVLEAINGLIQAAKRRARGYRNPHNLITMVYLLLGKLDLRIPAFATHATHTK